MDKTPSFVTIKIWETSLQALRFIRAYTGESQVAIIDRLAAEEFERLRQQGKAESHDDK